MNKGEFFENIVKNYDNYEEKIIAILQARGFLIDKIQDEYYISDNATYNDYEYLKYGFDKYNLGEMEEAKFVPSHNEGKYRVIVPKTGKIHIRSNVEIESVIDFFEERERVYAESLFRYDKWLKYIREIHARKCDVRLLEPYVAYYAKAVSSCGINTNYSCDGNHEQGGSIQFSCDYPSSIFHELICENFLVKIDADICKIYDGGISFDTDNQYDKYFKVYLCADWLYRNRGYFRGIKYEISDRFTNIEAKHESNEYLEKKFKIYFEEKKTEVIR